MAGNQEGDFQPSQASDLQFCSTTVTTDVIATLTTTVTTVIIVTTVKFTGECVADAKLLWNASTRLQQWLACPQTGNLTRQNWRNSQWEKGFQSRKTQIKVWHHSCEKFREKFWGGNWWKASDADIELNQVRMRKRMQGCQSLIVGCGQHPCGHWHQPLHMVDNSHCAWSPVHAQAANIHRFCISIWYILYLGIPQSVCRTSWHQIASPGGIFRLATAPLILYRKTMFNCAWQSVR